MAAVPNGTASAILDNSGGSGIKNGMDGIAEIEMSPVTILPHEIIEKLAELDLELSEGNYQIT